MLCRFIISIKPETNFSEDQRDGSTDPLPVQTTVI